MKQFFMFYTFAFATQVPTVAADQWYSSRALGRQLYVSPDGIHASCPVGDGECYVQYRFTDGFLNGVFLGGGNGGIYVTYEVENPRPGCSLDDLDNTMMGILNSDGVLNILP